MSLEKILWPVLQKQGFESPNGNDPVLLGRSVGRVELADQFSEIYLARHEGLASLVAVKCTVGEDHAQATFVRSLHDVHGAEPGVNAFARIYDVYSVAHGPLSYTIAVQEAFPDRVVFGSERINLHGVSPSAFIRGGKQLLDGFSLLHSQQKALKDPSPANILVTTAGEDPKLIDVGVQKYDSHGRVGEFTHGFTPPNNDTPGQDRMTYAFLALQVYGAERYGLTDLPIMQQLQASLQKWKTTEAATTTLEQLSALYTAVIAEEDRLLHRAVVSRRLFVAGGVAGALGGFAALARLAYAGGLAEELENQSAADKVAALTNGVYAWNRRTTTVPIGHQVDGETEIVLGADASSYYGAGFSELLLAAAAQRPDILPTAMAFVRNQASQMHEGNFQTGSSTNLFSRPIYRAFLQTRDRALLKPIVAVANHLCSAKTVRGNPLLKEFPGGLGLSFDRLSWSLVGSPTLALSKDVHGIDACVLGGLAARALGREAEAQQYFSVAQALLEPVQAMVRNGWVGNEADLSTKQLKVTAGYLGEPVAVTQVQVARTAWDLGVATNNAALKSFSRDLLAVFETDFPYSVGTRFDPVMQGYKQRRDAFAAACILSLARQQDNSLKRFAHLEDALRHGRTFSNVSAVKPLLSEVIAPLAITPYVAGIIPEYRYERNGIVSGITVPEPETRPYGLGVRLENVSLAWADAAIVDAFPKHTKMAE